MQKLFSALSLLQIAMLGSVSAEPIENLFVNAFEKRTGINVRLKNIDEINIYEVEEFSEEEKNRNHYDNRGIDPIQFLVMHYTVCDFPTTMNLFTSNVDSGRVSSHYVISETEQDKGIHGGLIFQIAPEAKRSWHAGVSAWQGVKNLNATSIGIENVSKGFIGNESENPTWFAFNPMQIASLGQLSQHIVKEHKILPQNVVGHADIAPGRKQDPGILFPWEELYTQYKVGAWLTEAERNPQVISEQFLPKEKLPQGISEAFFLKSLSNYGYSFPESAYITEENKGVVKSFKSHFSRNQHPESYDVVIDETEMLWAWGLEAKYK